MSRLTHGMKNTSEYKVWSDAKARCHNPNNQAYKSYGGRGIEMCQLWRESFMEFYLYIGPRPEKYQLDRIDNNKGYEPGNVRWTTVKINQNNRRDSVRITYKGEVMTVQEYAKLKGISNSGAWARLKLCPYMIEGKRENKVGEASKSAKLSNLDVLNIKGSLEKTKVLCQKYGVSDSLIRRIRCGKARKIA